MWMLNFMLKPCCRNLFKIADLFCHLASSFNRTARLYTRQSWLKTGSLPTAVNSLVKMNDLRTCLTSTLWTTMSGQLCLKATCHFNPAGEYRWAQESSAVDMEPAATRLDQQSHTELPEKTSGLCESWWWTLRTNAKMNYLWDFGICNNSQCFMKMKMTSCCWLFHTYGIEYLYSHNFGEYKNNFKNWEL